MVCSRLPLQPGPGQRDLVPGPDRLTAGDRHPVAGRLRDGLRRGGAVQVRMADDRRARSRGATGRRGVAGQRGLTPAVRIGLDAVEGRPAEPGAVVDVAQGGRAGRRGVVLVVGGDVQPHVLRIDRRRQIGHRHLDLDVVTTAGVAVVDAGVVAADPGGGRGHLDPGRVRSLGHGLGQRSGRIALVVVGVTFPARAVLAVAVAVGRVVGEREDAELERVGGVQRVGRGVALRVDLELDRVGQPVGLALVRRDRVGLVVVADVGVEVERVGLRQLTLAQL